MAMTKVYVVDGARTPLLKARGQPGPFSACDLATAAGRALLLRLPIRPTDIDEVIMGCVMPRETEANMGRLVALRLGCGDDTPGWTVQRNCASGMQALHSAMKEIQLGHAELVLAGGTEAMSHATWIWPDQWGTWFNRFAGAKSLKDRFSLLLDAPLRNLKPIPALVQGLSDPLSGLGMGQTAEIVASRFGITRLAMDQFAVESHQRAARATARGLGDEVVPLYDFAGQVYLHDEGVRADCSLEGLAKLKPAFERHGIVTAGTSSQVSDGAAMLLLASEAAVKKFKLPVKGILVDVEWAALSPDVMGLGPAVAMPPLLARHKLSLSDVAYWEINEAFAAQVLGCLAAWEDETFCRETLKQNAVIGALDRTRLNVDGGAVALGHPVGASGARIVLHLLSVLARENAKRGMASICIGGGQGGAMLLETTA